MDLVFAEKSLGPQTLIFDPLTDDAFFGGFSPLLGAKPLPAPPVAVASPPAAVTPPVVREFDLQPLLDNMHMVLEQYHLEQQTADDELLLLMH